MKTSLKFNRTVVFIISYLYVFLFTYGAISKLKGYTDFSIKIGQSPILSPFADTVAIGVPVLELLIAVLLCLPRLRIIGLYASFCLMIAFTTYIVIILNFSSFIPCSCGGVLENMGWTAHLIFNLVFILLALFALFLSYYTDRNCFSTVKPLSFYGTLMGGLFASSLSLVFLFVLSEDTMHKRNNFVRRFPSHASLELKKIDLRINSYYFAGQDDQTIYLGNYTTPAYVTIIDAELNHKSRARIQPSEPNLPFQDIKLRVLPPYFFVTDGSIPAIFKGSTKDWIADRQHNKIPFFTLFEAIDSSTVVLRLTSLKSKKNRLVIYDLKDQNARIQNTQLLAKEKNGIFDSDGMLHYNPYSKQLHYIFYYKNKFFSSDEKGNRVVEGKTIDTVEMATVKSVVNAAGDQELAKPSLLINKGSYVYKNLLFIKSERIGKYEDEQMIKQASIIDVYNLQDNTYVGSQYIYDIEEFKLKSFIVIQNKLYGLSGKFLSVVRISEKITNAYQ